MLSHVNQCIGNGWLWFRLSLLCCQYNHLYWLFLWTISTTLRCIYYTTNTDSVHAVFVQPTAGFFMQLFHGSMSSPQNGSIDMWIICNLAEFSTGWLQPLYWMTFNPPTGLFLTFYQFTSNLAELSTEWLLIYLNSLLHDFWTLNLKFSTGWLFC